MLKSRIGHCKSDYAPLGPWHLNNWCFEAPFARGLEGDCPPDNFLIRKSGGRYKVRTCGPSRVKGVLYH